MVQKILSVKMLIFFVNFPEAIGFDTVKSPLHFGGDSYLGLFMICSFFAGWIHHAVLFIAHWISHNITDYLLQWFIFK